MSTPSQPLSDAEYQRLTSSLFAAIESQLDRWLEEDVVDIDARRNGGVLELTFPNRSKLILNTQPPLQEVWLAARDGGFHYRWDGQAWRDTRDGSEFLAALSLHTSAQAGQPLKFKA